MQIEQSSEDITSDYEINQLIFSILLILIWFLKALQL